jgi:hypothetical protein
VTAAVLTDSAASALLAYAAAAVAVAVVAAVVYFPALLVSLVFSFQGSN